MGAREAAVGSHPKCPKCGGAKVDALASDDLFSRYQCADLKCFHDWRVPRRSVSELLEQERRRRAMKAEEVVEMATKETRGDELACRKCEKPFRFQAWLERHEKKCKGEKPAAAARPRDNDGSVEEDPDLPVPRRRRATPPPSSSEGEPREPLVVVDHASGEASPKQRVLNMLEVEEEQLTKKLGDVKRLIAVVRQVEEGGRE